MGVSIVGGARSTPGNPDDKTDEGVFISKVRARVRPSSVSTFTAAVPVNVAVLVMIKTLSTACLFECKGGML